MLPSARCTRSGWTALCAKYSTKGRSLGALMNSTACWMNRSRALSSRSRPRSERRRTGVAAGSMSSEALPITRLPSTARSDPSGVRSSMSSAIWIWIHPRRTSQPASASSSARVWMIVTVLGSIVASGAVAKLFRRSGLSAGSRELAAGAITLLPAALALRGPDLAEYHGAEHISIGTYENGGEPAPKEHPRCGSQLIAPLLASSLVANVVAAKAPAPSRGVARLLGTTAAVGASVELFGWATRNPAHPVARAIARPGLELQRRFSTAEPTAEQLEVANAARDACLELERSAA